MAFLVKCLECDNVDTRYDPNRLIGCSSCSNTRRLQPICAACGKGIANQDVKECKDMVICASRECWNIQWNK
jgi:hypothetical protein